VLGRLIHSAPGGAAADGWDVAVFNQGHIPITDYAWVICAYVS